MHTNSKTRPFFAEMLDQPEIRKILGIEKDIKKLYNFRVKRRHVARYICPCGHEFTVGVRNDIPDFLFHPCSECCHSPNKEARIKTIWNGMMARCTNKDCVSYHNYGGRGIKVCDSWKDYKSFERWALDNGYRDGLSIERTDVNGDYCPSNCTWIPIRDQAKNRRISYKNRYLEHDGLRLSYTKWAERIGTTPDKLSKYIALYGDEAFEKIQSSNLPSGKNITIGNRTQNLKCWLKEYGLSREAYRLRIKKGMSPEHAITAPKHPGRR